MTTLRPAVFVFLLLALGAVGEAHAQEQAPPAADPSEPVAANVARARALYLEGVSLVEAARWGDALAAFQRSSAERPHATTLFNIASCERALARYTAAWLTFRKALARAEDHPDELPSALLQEAEARVAEMLALFARVTVVLDPASAAVSVDGAPLTPRSEGGRDTVWVSGLASPGPGRAVEGRFELWLDPGAHVLMLGRKGYAPVAVNRTFAPGARAELRLRLDRIPAELDVQSNVLGAVVTVDGADVGVVPVQIERPRGRYRVVVRKEGYDPYEATVQLNPGERTSLRAVLREERISVLKRWWFWAGAAAVVAGGAGITYAVTRPEPEPPPYRSGNTGWLVVP